MKLNADNKVLKDNVSSQEQRLYQLEKANTMLNIENFNLHSNLNGIQKDKGQVSELPLKKSQTKSNKKGENTEEILLPEGNNFTNEDRVLNRDLHCFEKMQDGNGSLNSTEQELSSWVLKRMNK